MKRIRYTQCVEVNRGTDDNPVIEKVFTVLTHDYNETTETIAKAEAYNGEYTIEDAPDDRPLAEIQAARVAASKTALADYLASHPLTWVDGNQYSVTAEKQSLLTSQIALYQTANAAGQSYDLRWNSTGGECTSWSIENLSALALAIGAYVQPLVSYQQAKELELLACKTVEELEAVEVDYAALA